MVKMQAVKESAAVVFGRGGGKGTYQVAVVQGMNGNQQVQYYSSFVVMQ